MGPAGVMSLGRRAGQRGLTTAACMLAFQCLGRSCLTGLPSAHIAGGKYHCPQGWPVCALLHLSNVPSPSWNLLEAVLVTMSLSHS